MYTATFVIVFPYLQVIPKKLQDAEELRKIVLRSLTSYGLAEETDDGSTVSPRIRGFVSDTTAVMPSIAKMLGVPWIPCCCHVLNLVAKKGLKVRSFVLFSTESTDRGGFGTS